MKSFIFCVSIIVDSDIMLTCAGRRKQSQWWKRGRMNPPQKEMTSMDKISDINFRLVVDYPQDKKSQEEQASY